MRGCINRKHERGNPTCARSPCRAWSPVRWARGSATEPEEVPLGFRGCHRGGALVGVGRLAGPAEPPKQVSSGGVERVVVVQVQLIHQNKAAAGPCTSPMAMAWLRATTGIGATASSRSYRATICASRSGPPQQRPRARRRWRPGADTGRVGCGEGSGGRLPDPPRSRPDPIGCGPARPGSRSPPLQREAASERATRLSCSCRMGGGSVPVRCLRARASARCTAAR
jgi:hypothetical protein